MNSPLGHHSQQLVSFCPLCDARTSPVQTKVLAEDGTTRLVHVTCRKCGGATLSLLLENEAGASTVGMVTDLSHEDVLRFRHGTRVTTDDVIEVHKAMGMGLTELFALPARKRRAPAKARAKTRRTA